MWFDENDKDEYRDSLGISTIRTYSEHDGSITNPPLAGDWFAMRWGLHDRAVMVFRISDEHAPIVYGDAIPYKEGRIR